MFCLLLSSSATGQSCAHVAYCISISFSICFYSLYLIEIHMLKYFLFISLCICYQPKLCTYSATILCCPLAYLSHQAHLTFVFSFCISISMSICINTFISVCIRISLSIFIGPRYTWGPIYGSQCLFQTD